MSTVHGTYDTARLLAALETILARLDRRAPAARAIARWAVSAQTTLGIDFGPLVGIKDGEDTDGDGGRDDEPDISETLIQAKPWRRFIAAVSKRRAEIGETKPDPLAVNAASLAEAAGLEDPADRALLETVARIGARLWFANFERAALSGDAFQPEDVIAAIAGIEPETARTALRAGRLSASGLLDPRERASSGLAVGLPWRVQRALEPPERSRADLERALLGHPCEPELALEDFDHIADDVATAVDLLRAATAHGEAGVHILLHGEPGVGKSALARVIADAAGVKLFAVGETDEEGEEPSRWDRQNGYALAQRLTRSRKDCVLLFEEMEDLLDSGDSTEWLGRRYVVARSKVYLNRLLEKSTTPTLWTTNRADRFDPALLRRMTFALELTTPPAAARERIWKRLLEQSGLSDDAGAAGRLARRFAASPGLAANAVRAAKLAGGGAQTAERVASALARALGERGGPKENETAVTIFDPRLWNADIDLADLARRLAARDGPVDFSLCISGPPGSGKSAYVQRLANELGLDLVRKRASDLFSMWVGETEKKIADAFAEAQNTRAFLVFDEADSLLGDRRDANRSWEISQVNEMLTWMESHDLPFACTTNLFDRMDPASLRRFTFKVKLDYLSREQKRLAYDLFFARTAPAELDDVEPLTPGDFKVAKEKLRYLDPPTDGDIVALLAREAASKPGGGRRMGY